MIRPIKTVTFPQKNDDPPNLVVGFLRERVTSLMSSSRMLQKIMEIVDVFVDLLQQQQQTLDSVEDFASVAEHHANLPRFRTNTVVRAVVFLFVLSHFFIVYFLFFSFIFHFSCFSFFPFLIFFRTLIRGKNRREVPTVKMTIFLCEDSIFGVSVDLRVTRFHFPFKNCVFHVFLFCFFFKVFLLFLFLVFLSNMFHCWR